MSNVYHSSLEGAQHGPKGLDGFLKFAKESGASGAQPSNFHLQAPDSGAQVKFRTPAEIKCYFEKHELSFDGISCHCPFWVHTTAWTGDEGIRPFIPAEVAKMSPAEIEAWEENYILRLFDLAGELGIKILPMFWGLAWGHQVASGYPWGFWSGDGFDLIQEGNGRFLAKTKKIREEANKRGLYLAHEIHPNSGAMCADDFNRLVELCGGDQCVVVNFDPSHCWEGESWQTRIQKVGSRIYAAHIKNFVIRPGLPLRSATADWKDRGMQFTDLPSGDINMHRYAEELLRVGYPQRYWRVTGRQSAPLVVEAESAHKDPDYTSRNGIIFVRDNLCWPAAKGSFEDGMGA